MPTAREDSVRLADLLRREHHALAEFLIALAEFDRDARWREMGYRSLFEYLRRELKLSAGAAQYRKAAAALVQAYPGVEAALRRGDLCLSSVVEVAKVLTPENADEVLPKFFGKSARDAAFVSSSIRPVENPPVRDFVVTPVRAPALDLSAAPAPSSVRTSEVAPIPPRPRDGLARGLGARRRTLRVAPGERRRLRLHLPGRARPHRRLRPRRRHDGRRVPPPLPVPPGRLRAPALR